MVSLSALFVVLNVLATAVNAKAVFAHVVVGDTAAHKVDTWITDIVYAQNAGIDAFALNIASTDPNTPVQVANAFAAASSVDSGFKLFFSFDYAASPWPADQVVNYLNKYGGSPQYYLQGGAKFVSTFEGPGNAGDWAPGGSIRSQVGKVYFVPDWSSLGPGGLGGVLGNIEGAFSWDMWPNGATNMNTAADKRWISALGSKSYMMGVSPLFFHSASGGQKWVWRGDSLWADRWAQVAELSPDFVQIVTWNDYGESSYIGPIWSSSEIPAGSGQFVQGFPHDSYRTFLPYYISVYKGAPKKPGKDHVQYWYRTTPAAAGSSCGVTGNIASQGQTEVDPNKIVQDAVFFSTLLPSAATVTVTIGNGPPVKFEAPAGVKTFSVPFGGRLGAPVIKVTRAGLVTAQGTGTPILAGGGCTNYNTWAGDFSS